MTTPNGASPQPDQACRGQLPVFAQTHAGTCGQAGRPPPPATPRCVDHDAKCVSAGQVRFRCANGASGTHGTPALRASASHNLTQNRGSAAPISLLAAPRNLPRRDTVARRTTSLPGSDQTRGKSLPRGLAGWPSCVTRVAAWATARTNDQPRQNGTPRCFPACAQTRFAQPRSSPARNRAVLSGRSSPSRPGRARDPRPVGTRAAVCNLDRY